MANLKSFSTMIPASYQGMIMVLVIMLFLVGITKLGEKLGNKKYSKKFLEEINLLLKDAARLSSMALQDHDQMAALLHTNTALAHVKAVRQFLSDKEIERLTDVHIPEFVEKLEALQEATLKVVGMSCPTIESTLVEQANLI